MDNLLIDLLSLPPEGVYALINDSKKTILIQSSMDIHASVLRMIKGIRLGENGHYRNIMKDIETIRFVVLETVEDRNILRMRENYWVDYYRNSNTVKYKIVTLMEVKGGSSRVVVYIQNSQRKRILVGVFDSLREAEYWTEKKYGEGVYGIVYADNEYTRDMLSEVVL